MLITLYSIASDLQMNRSPTQITVVQWPSNVSRNHQRLLWRKTPSKDSRTRRSPMAWLFWTFSRAGMSTSTSAETFPRLFFGPNVQLHIWCTVCIAFAPFEPHESVSPWHFAVHYAAALITQQHDQEIATDWRTDSIGPNLCDGGQIPCQGR